jgi:hypothetical protein
VADASVGLDFGADGDRIDRRVAIGEAGEEGVLGVEAVGETGEVARESAQEEGGRQPFEHEAGRIREVGRGV